MSLQPAGPRPNPHGGRNDRDYGQRNSGDNRCRFPQVECLSDICTAEGSTTDPGLGAPSAAVRDTQNYLATLVVSVATVEPYTRFHEQPA
jgi:hypothetical protein